MGMYSALKSLESPPVFNKFLQLPIAKQAFGGALNRFAQANPLQAASGMNIMNNGFVALYGISTGNARMVASGFTFMGANLLLGLEPDKLTQNSRMGRFFQTRAGSKIANAINFQFTSKVMKVGAGGFMFFAGLPIAMNRIHHYFNPTQEDRQKSGMQKAGDAWILVDSVLMMARGGGNILANAAYAPTMLTSFTQKYGVEVATRFKNIGSFGNQIGATTGAAQSIIAGNIFNFASAICNYVGNVYTNWGSDAQIQKGAGGAAKGTIGANFFKDVLIPGMKKHWIVSSLVAASCLTYFCRGYLQRQNTSHASVK